jgi:hypothetical protein
MASFVADCKAEVRRSGKSAVGRSFRWEQSYGRALRGGKLIVFVTNMSRAPSVVYSVCTTQKVLQYRVRLVYSVL